MDETVLQQSHQSRAYIQRCDVPGVRRAYRYLILGLQAAPSIYDGASFVHLHDFCRVASSHPLVWGPKLSTRERVMELCDQAHHTRRLTSGAAAKLRPGDLAGQHILGVGAFVGRSMSSRLGNIGADVRRYIQTLIWR